MLNEIIGGLKIAMLKGEKIEEAMMSFYNAGYEKKDIEEAAKLLLQAKSRQELQKEPIPQTPVAVKPKKEKVLPKQPKPIQEVSSYEAKPPKKKFSLFKSKKKKPLKVKKEKRQIVPPPNAPVSKQTVSEYDEMMGKPKGKLLILILVFLLLFLFAILAAVFLLKDEIVNFLNNLL